MSPRSTSAELDFPAVLAEHSGGFTDAVSTPGVWECPVPSCPDWQVRHLVEHMARVQALWNWLLVHDRGPTEQEVAELGSSPLPVLQWWQQTTERFQADLAATDPEAVMYGWWADGQRDTVAAVTRRMAHEAVIHRWDAENATGAATPLPERVAADGVTEFLERFLRSEREWKPARGSVVLLTGDGGYEWWIDVGANPRMTPPGNPGADSGEPLVTVRGSAEQLNLLVWGRCGLGAVEVDGDEELAFRLLAWPSM